MPINIDDYGPVAAANNLKMFADAGASAPMLASLDAVSHQRQTNSIREMFLGVMAKRYLDPSAIDSVVTQKLMTGSDALQQGSGVTGLGVMAKLLELTPPQTAHGRPVYVDPSKLV